MRRLVLSAVAAVALGATPARAVGLGVDVGAGTWLVQGVQADAHVRLEQELFDLLSIGVRPGLEITLDQPTSRVGIPLDAYARLKVAILYVEALGGLYWIPSSIDPVRWHVAAGAGVQIWKLTVGVEVGYLQPSVNLLGRVGFTFF